MDEKDLLKFQKDINDGFSSIRDKMSEGFTASNDKITELAVTVSGMSGRFDGIISKQLELDREMNKLKEMKDDVEKNTEFRKKIQRINWEIAKPIIYIVVVAIVVVVATSIIQNGVGG